MVKIVALDEDAEAYALEAVRVGGVDEAYRVVKDYVAKEEKVLLIGKGAWSFYSTIASKLRSEGENFYLIEALEPFEAELAGIPFQLLLTARIAYLTRRPAEKALPEPATDKRLTRRELLSSGVIGSVFDYTEKPIEAELCRRKPVARLCADCMKMCKEPCAASAALCGIELLLVPGYSRQGLHDFLRITANRLNGPGFIVFMPRSSISSLLERLKAIRPSAPTLIVPVSCPYVVGLEELLAVRALGLKPLLFTLGWEVELKRCKESTEPYLKSVVRDYTIITREAKLVCDDDAELLEILSKQPQIERKQEALEALQRGLRPLALVELRNRGIMLGLNTLFSGTAIVDKSKCTVCGACARECPAMALRVVESKETSSLLFMHDRCIACRWCEDVCPENAISIRVAVDSRLIGSWTPLHEERQVKCIVCGKPIGPRSLVESVVEKLLKSGFKVEDMPSLLMCSECRQKYNLGLIEKEQVNWEYFRRFVERVRVRTGGRS